MNKGKLEHDQYIANFKKDGVHLKMKSSHVLTKRENHIKSNLAIKRFKRLANICEEVNICLDGYFYMHGVKKSILKKFLNSVNVSGLRNKNRLEKEKVKNPEKFKSDYDDLDIDFLTTFHKDLKFHIFDGKVLDVPEDLGYLERMKEILRRLAPFREELYEAFVPIGLLVFKNQNGIDNFSEIALKNEYRELELIHKDRPYGSHEKIILKTS